MENILVSPLTDMYKEHRKRGLKDLLDTYGMTLVSNHGMTTDEVLELFGFTVDNETGEIILHTGFGQECTGFYYDEIEYN